MPDAVRVVHDWHTTCGACGYGGGSWADSPAREGKPIITSETEACPGCGAVFTGSVPARDARFTLD